MLTNESAKAAAFRALENRFDEHVQTLRAFLQIPSTLGNEKPAQLWLARQMRRLGLMVDLVECDPEELSGLPGWTPTDWSYNERPNVVGIWPGVGAGALPGSRSLILNAHVDVASPEPVELWTHDPWGGEIVGSRIYGRGAQDDKAGCCEILFVVQALRDAGLRPRGTLMLQSVIEDECTGNGTLALVARGYDADAAIVVDGTGPGRAIISHPGQLAFRVTIYGKPGAWGSAHRAVNAIEKSSVIVTALRRLEAEKNRHIHPLWSEIEHPVNLNFFGIHGGEWLGNVAARCVCDFGLTFLPPDTLESTRATIERVIAEAASADPWLCDHPPRVTYNALATPPVLGESDSELFRTLGENHQATFGKPLNPAPITGWCDLRHFHLRRPAQALLFGPGGGGGAHCPDEWFNLNDLLPITKTLIGATIDWLGVTRA